jgi:hypothetical protein
MASQVPQLHLHSRAARMIMITHDRFFQEIHAQIDFIYQKWIFILHEFNNAEFDDQISMAGRLATKELISAIKQVLDQLTFRMWSVLIEPQLNEEISNVRRRMIYFPYGIDEQSFSSTKGKMVSTKDKDTDEKREFESWLKANSPAYSGSSGLTTICELARLPHSKLIEQRKVKKYRISAFTKDGGGAEMIMDNPTAISIVLVTGPHGTGVSFSGKIENVAEYVARHAQQYPSDNIQIITFDPEKIGFDTYPQDLSLTSEAKEFLTCHVENYTFNLIEIFPVVLGQLMQVVDTSRAILANRLIA